MFQWATKAGLRDRHGETWLVKKICDEVWGCGAVITPGGNRSSLFTVQVDIDCKLGDCRVLNSGWSRQSEAELIACWHVSLSRDDNSECNDTGSFISQVWLESSSCYGLWNVDVDVHHCTWTILLQFFLSFFLFWFCHSFFLYFSFFLFLFSFSVYILSHFFLATLYTARLLSLPCSLLTLCSRLPSFFVYSSVALPLFSVHNYTQTLSTLLL